MLIVAACGTADPAPGPNAPNGGEVEILTAARPSGMEALSAFVLQYDPDANCLFHLEEDNNGEPGTGGRVVIIWPPGYTARSQGDSVTVFNEAGQAVARTDVPFMLAGGGGPTSRDHCGAVGEWVANGEPRPVLDGA